MKGLLLSILLITGCTTGFKKGACFEDTEPSKEVEVKLVVAEVEEVAYLVNFVVHLGNFNYVGTKAVEKKNFEKAIKESMDDKTMRFCK